MTITTDVTETSRTGVTIQPIVLKIPMLLPVGSASPLGLLASPMIIMRWTDNLFILPRRQGESDLRNQAVTTTSQNVLMPECPSHARLVSEIWLRLKTAMKSALVSEMEAPAALSPRLRLPA